MGGREEVIAGLTGVVCREDVGSETATTKTNAKKQYAKQVRSNCFLCSAGLRSGAGVVLVLCLLWLYSLVKVLYRTSTDHPTSRGKAVLVVEYVNTPSVLCFKIDSQRFRTINKMNDDVVWQYAS